MANPLKGKCEPLFMFIFTWNVHKAVRNLHSCCTLVCLRELTSGRRFGLEHVWIVLAIVACEFFMMEKYFARHRRKKYTLLMELCQSSLSSGLFWARCEQWKSLTSENSLRLNKWTKSIRQWLLWLLAASTQRPLYDAISLSKWLCTSFEPFAVKLCAWGGCVWICSSQRNFMWSIISSKWQIMWWVKARWIDLEQLYKTGLSLSLFELEARSIGITFERYGVCWVLLRMMSMGVTNPLFGQWATLIILINKEQYSFYKIIFDSGYHVNYRWLGWKKLKDAMYYCKFEIEMGRTTFGFFLVFLLLKSSL